MIEKIRVTNRSMPESKLRSVDSGTVFGQGFRSESGSGEGMGTAQIGAGTKRREWLTEVCRAQKCGGFTVVCDKDDAFTQNQTRADDPAVPHLRPVHCAGDHQGAPLPAHFNNAVCHHCQHCGRLCSRRTVVGRSSGRAQCRCNCNIDH